MKRIMLFFCFCCLLVVLFPQHARLQPTYNVTFHVSNEGNDLQDAWVTVGPVALQTNASGIAVFSLQDGEHSYTVTKPGYTDAEGIFTVAGVPLFLEVEMEVCWEVIIHVSGCDSATININGEILVADENGFADTCLVNGNYYISIGCEGFWPYTGMFIVNNSPITLNIILMPITYPVTFFVNCCGAPLEGIMVSIGSNTFITGANGQFTATNLNAGNYSVGIGGYVFNFTLPGTTYIDANICSELTYHVTNEQGYPLENVLISMGQNNLLTDINGEANICLQVGSYNYSASKFGYVTQTGTFEMDTIAQTIEIVMPVQTWGVTINVTGFECDNEFEELIIICNGDTVSVSQPIYLENGSYNFEVAILGCPYLLTGNFEVDNAPQTVQVILNDFPKAYIHVSWAGYPVSYVAVVLDNEDTLYTNGYGTAIFCVGGGNHIVHIPEYGFYEGEFTFNCTEDIHYYYLGGIGINEINSENIFQLYPNPSSGTFTIENLNPTGEPTEIFVTDITGRFVYQTSTSNLDKTEIDLSEQPKGMYFVRVKSGEGLLTQKIIIQ